MDILREISKTSQVILATHSPLVINELIQKAPVENAWEVHLAAILAPAVASSRSFSAPCRC